MDLKPTGKCRLVVQAAEVCQSSPGWRVCALSRPQKHCFCEGWWGRPMVLPSVLTAFKRNKRLSLRVPDTVMHFVRLFGRFLNNDKPRKGTAI